MRNTTIETIYERIHHYNIKAALRLLMLFRYLNNGKIQKPFQSNAFLKIVGKKESLLIGA